MAVEFPEENLHCLTRSECTSEAATSNFMEARSYQLRIFIGMFAKFMGLERYTSKMCAWSCVPTATVMRMIPTIYGHLVKWIYMRLSFSACMQC